MKRSLDPVAAVAVAALIFVSTLATGREERAEGAPAATYAAPAAPAGAPRPDLRGRAGLYYRYDKREQGENLTHPLVDAIVLGIHWSDVEPRKGVFDFSSVRAQVDKWGRAGKGVVLNLTLYGQEPQGDERERTPQWVWSTGVTKIEFPGGGVARGQSVRIPKVWDDAFVTERLEPLVAAYAKEFNGNPHVWFVVPGFGHIGFINAQPSKDGAPAMVAAGWTPERWRSYCLKLDAIYAKHFDRTPRIVISGPMLLRVRASRFYRDEAADLVRELGGRGASVISLGLSSRPADAREVHDRLAPLAPAARRGAIRLGIGDDWPLWVPASRRGRGPTQGYDDTNLQRLIDLALGGIEQLPRTPVTILYAQMPEISASNPKTADYQPRVFEIMKQARQRLLENDAEIFGKR